ncbi:MAG: hypothetical protein LUC33_05820, partial [Prevotellaceae bacterium]|nr:hypothetical protein [Prevotellaceae bacterium]
DKLEGLYETLGWSREGYSQSASTGGYTQMSEDTAEELNGRFTALQEAAYELLDEARGNGLTLSQMNEPLVQQASLVEQRLGGIGDIASDIRNAMESGYLELVQIQENTAGALTQLQSVAKYIKQVKENTDKL